MIASGVDYRVSITQSTNFCFNLMNWRRGKKLMFAAKDVRYDNVYFLNI